tara:strand:+ start:1178 stop:2035 length:858 start_codon:yes stop_codon:yes gene_type:complete
MKTIGIIGQGFVGSAVNEGLAKHFNIETFDIAKESTCKSLEELDKKSDLIFICLPTPMQKNGECHLGVVEPVLEELSRLQVFDGVACAVKTIVVKSTIPPGTTDTWNKNYACLDIVFNPEFLTEANSIEDFKNQNRIIIGGPRRAATQVRRIFKKVFPKVPIIKTNAKTAEMIKYFTNCFLATKVSFANEMYNVCGKLDIDYDKVIEYAQYDERIGHSHLEVPGPDGKVGFGGSCFPKDMLAMISIGENLGMDLNTLQGAWETNTEVRPERDWEELKGRSIIKED